jgi:hypothetical protein
MAGIQETQERFPVSLSKGPFKEKKREDRFDELNANGQSSSIQDPCFDFETGSGKRRQQCLNFFPACSCGHGCPSGTDTISMARS